MSNTGTLRHPITPDEVAIVIPARMESTRLPGKPLRVVRGKPMVLWALEAAQAAVRAKWAFVVADDLDVYRAVKDAGGDVVRLEGTFSTGSDRIAAFVAATAFTRTAKIVVNLQCDEPDITGADLDRLIQVLIDHKMVQVATYRCPWGDTGGGENWSEPIHGVDEAISTAFSNVVKVVCDRNNNALYFSRAEIPGDVHVGVYAYRRRILESFARYPRGELEKAEDLEQLRLLENGVPIRVLDLGRSVWSVNTEADLKAVNDG